jgi:hypothetical protein
MDYWMEMWMYMAGGVVGIILLVYAVHCFYRWVHRRQGKNPDDWDV